MLRNLLRGVFVVTLVFIYGAVGGDGTSRFGSEVTELSLKVLRNLYQFKNDSQLRVNSLTFYKMFLMTYIITAGKSREEIKNLLDLKIEGDELLKLFNDLEAQTIPGVIDLKHLFFNVTYNPKDSIKTALEDYMSSIDFSKESAFEEINNWVNETTKGEIGTVYNRKLENNESSSLVLVGVTMMTAPLKVTFSRNDTTERNFTQVSGFNLSVKMLTKTDNHEYLDSDELKCEIIKLPYEGERLSFVAFLPRVTVSIKEFIDSLNYKSIKAEIERTTSKRLTLYIPRIGRAYKMNLEYMISKLGLPNIFSAGANFSSFTDGSGVHLSKVPNLAYINFKKDDPIPASKTTDSGLTVEFNRPFFYLVYDKITESPVFMGTKI